MNDKTSLKSSLYQFHKAASRLLRSQYDDSPLSFQRFLNHIESDPIIREYIEDCVTLHIPEGFSAEDMYADVSSDYHRTFGPFSISPKEESAQVYLILKELVAQNVQGRSVVFFAYAPKKFQDKYQGFLESVARRLIENIECHLGVIGIEAGLDDSNDATTNNFYGPIGNAQINQSSGKSVINARQDNSIDQQELSRILNDMLKAAKDELNDSEALENVAESLESIQEQLTSDNPKRSIIKGCVSLLKSANAGVQFSSALASLIEFLIEHGITIPL